MASRYFRSLFFFFSAFAITCSASFAFSLPGPVFEPRTELRLHDAIGAEGIVTPSDLNGRLREVDIRTALADTARWRGELG